MNWYLLQCKPNQQRRAEEHLGNQGFVTYAPHLNMERVIRRKRLVRPEPVFPGYLFIQLNAQSDWKALMSTRGVTRVVSFNGKPQVVADRLIDSLRRYYSGHGIPVSLFKPGDTVRVAEGCFKDMQAIVKAVTPDERVIVLLNIMHSQQAVAFPVAQLAKAG